MKLEEKGKQVQGKIRSFYSKRQVWFYADIRYKSKEIIIGIDCQLEFVGTFTSFISCSILAIFWLRACRKVFDYLSQSSNFYAFSSSDFTSKKCSDSSNILLSKFYVIYFMEYLHPVDFRLISLISFSWGLLASIFFISDSYFFSKGPSYGAVSDVSFFSLVLGFFSRY